MTAVFADDSSAEDKRDAAFDRLYAMCPAAMRPVIRPMLQQVVNGATDEQIGAILIDVDRVRQMAEAGNVNGIAEIARGYGATDAQIAAYLPGAIKPG